MVNGGSKNQTATSGRWSQNALADVYAVEVTRTTGSE